MMNWIFTGLIFLSVVIGLINGRIDLVSTAAINESYKAVELVIKLAGALCLWSGLMNIAQKSGLTKKLSKCFYPLTTRLFKGLDKDSPVMGAISMNLTANFLGLGNAATPIGIEVMKGLSAYSKDKTTATNHMIIFVVMNTASLQLIPTTTAMLRLSAGSTDPLVILPAVWVSSAISVFVGLTTAIFLSKFSKDNCVTTHLRNRKGRLY